MTVSRRENLPGSVRDHGLSLGRYEGRKQTVCGLRTPGAGLSKSADRKAPSEMSALKPYWGKPAVLNFREGYGNGGIIRSPLSAITLLDSRDFRRRFVKFCIASIFPGVASLAQAF